MPGPRPIAPSLLLIATAAAVAVAVAPIGSARAAEVGVVDAAATVIEARMPDDVSRAELDRAAIEGMTRWLDTRTGLPGNAVLSDAAFQARRARMRGERVGLGIDYTVVAGRGLVVTDVAAGSPAATGKLAPGDVIVAIDDRSFTGLTGPAIAAIVAERTGASRAAVVLDVRRSGDPLRRLALTPGPFRAAPARVTKHDDHLMVRIDVLGQGVTDLVAEALDRERPEVLVLDLRDLDEGEPEAVVALADLFVGPGLPLLLTVDPAERATAYESDAPVAWSGTLAVLINRGTAGVGEALAATLRAQAGASLVGSRSAGAASHPSFHPIGDGLVLQLADTGLRAPDGTSWAGEGLAPDLLVEALQVPMVGPIKAGPPDIQLDAALRYVGAR